MTTPAPERVATSSELRAALGALAVQRDFPWRRTRDPWRVLLAELCCQQTQANRAVPAYERLVARFESAAACARAPLAAVLEAFAGLGYYRRAVALHRSACAIVERHAGSVPDDLTALLALPGVGPYTARAVMAFAFERDVGVVDTNVARVLARAVAGRPLRAAEAQELADELVPGGRGWSHNQAMLDLGSQWCRPTPRCAGCPLERACAWRASGCAGDDPATRSAGVSRRQPPFAGSDREGRGRLLAAALRVPIPEGDLASAAGWAEDPTRAERVAAALVREGVLEWRDRMLVPAGSGRLDELRPSPRRPADSLAPVGRARA